MLDIKAIEKLPSFIFGSFGQRVGAYLIDILLIKAISSSVLNIYSLLGFYPMEGSFSLFNLTTVFIYFTYFILLTKCNKGETIGKMIFSLRVLPLYSMNLSWTDVLYRELIGRYIQKKVKILYLILFLTNKRQTMADLVTDTVVVSEKSYLNLTEYLTLEKKLE